MDRRACRLRGRSRPLWRALALALLSSWCLAAGAAGVHTRVLAVLSGSDPVYADTLDSFRSTLLQTVGGSLPIDFEVRTLDKPSDRTRPDPTPSFILAIGSEAARVVRQWSLPVPALNVLITQDAFSALWPTDERGPGRPPVSAIYLEQPLARQLQFIRLALPHVKRCGVIVSDLTRNLLPALETAAKETGVELDVVNAADFSKPVDSFRRVIDHNKAVLVLPDPEILSPSRAKWLLFMAYQQDVPVIGFSEAIVRAGALGAVYSTPDQIGRQAAESVLGAAWETLRQRDPVWALPPPDYPKYFEVSINQAVARSLDLDVRSDRKLAQSLTVLEQINRWRARY